jgi:transcriptional regulator with XRE-family HTH domain
MCAKVTGLTPAAIFARRVNEIRQLRGLTQTELARRVNIDRTTLNKIERGARGDVSISQLFAFAEALEIAPVYLISPRRTDENVELGGRTVSGREARAWVRGTPPPPSSGEQLAEWLLTLPQDEQLDWLIDHDPEIAATASSPLARMLVDRKAFAARIQQTVKTLDKERQRRTEGRR